MPRGVVLVREIEQQPAKLVDLGVLIFVEALRVPGSRGKGDQDEQERRDNAPARRGSFRQVAFHSLYLSNGLRESRPGRLRSASNMP